MVTDTKPKRQVTVIQSEVVLTPYREDVLSNFLGLTRAGRQPVLDELCRILSVNQTLLRGAPLAPLRAHHAKAFSLVQKDAARLYKTIAGTPDHHRALLPNLDAFVSQLAEFHDQVQMGLIQMRGRPSQRGGGKKQNVAMTKQAVEHSISMFFDLNSIGDGSRHDYLAERQQFIEYCMALIEPGAV